MKHCHQYCHYSHFADRKGDSIQEVKFIAQDYSVNGGAEICSVWHKVSTLSWVLWIPNKGCDTQHFQTYSATDPPHIQCSTERLENTALVFRLTKSNKRLQGLLLFFSARPGGGPVCSLQGLVWELGGVPRTGWDSSWQLLNCPDPNWWPHGPHVTHWGCQILFSASSKLLLQT